MDQSVKRSLHFISPDQYVTCRMEDGQVLRIPVAPGILKTLEHPALQDRLQDPDVVRKYTCEALRKAPWQVLREFPRAWLRRCLPAAQVPEDRRAALEFLLVDEP